MYNKSHKIQTNLKYRIKYSISLKTNYKMFYFFLVIPSTFRALYAMWLQFNQKFVYLKFQYLIVVPNNVLYLLYEIKFVQHSQTVLIRIIKTRRLRVGINTSRRVECIRTTPFPTYLSSFEPSRGRKCGADGWEYYTYNINGLLPKAISPRAPCTRSSSRWSSHRWAVKSNLFICLYEYNTNSVYIMKWKKRIN